jgi:hypothetical protein
MEAHDMIEDDDITEVDMTVDDAAQRPAGRPPMRSMLLRRAGDRG